MTAPDIPLRLSALPARAVLAVSGPDAVSFLDGLLTNSLEPLDAGQPVYAGLLSPQGKLLFDMGLARLRDHILLDVAAAQAGPLAQRLALYKLRAKVTVESRPDWTVSALWGAGALAHLSLRANEARSIGAGLAYADPRSEALGARLLLPPGETPPDVAAATSDAYDRMRFDIGVGEGEEIGNERCYPLEANFEPLHGVDFKKGCYVGQELTARMKHRGGLRKRVLPVRGDASLIVDGAIESGGKEIGTILAARGEGGLALLRLDRLADARGKLLTADGVGVSVHWPDFLPPPESAAS